jgi:hypothetical protein
MSASDQLFNLGDLIGFALTERTHGAVQVNTIEHFWDDSGVKTAMGSPGSVPALKDVRGPFDPRKKDKQNRSEGF